MAPRAAQAPQPPAPSSATPPPPEGRAGLVLAAALALLRPLVRLLLRQGVAYPAFATALKPVFLQAAMDELSARDMPATDSALSLMSGVHRRDVRSLLRGAPSSEHANPLASPAPGLATAGLSLAAEVATRWLADRRFLDEQGRARRLPRGGEDGFDALVASVSSDTRPRAVLDELKRLGAAQEHDDGVALSAESFAPRAGFQEMCAVFTDNLHDHLAAAAANLQDEANFLEQAVYVDQLTDASVETLRQTARQAWRDAFQTVMAQAQTRFDADEAQAPATERLRRVRFGVYFYSTRDDGPPSSPDSLPLRNLPAPASASASKRATRVASRRTPT